MRRALKVGLRKQSLLIFLPAKPIISLSAHDFVAKLSHRNKIYSLATLFSAAC